MILVYPPGARSSEPPLGIARLAGFLRLNGHEAQTLDLNQEALDWHIGLESPSPLALVTRDSGALRHRSHNASLLRDPDTYASPDRHKRAVLALDRGLKLLTAPRGVAAGLADYREESRSPLRKADLLSAAADWEASVFRPLFERRLEELLGRAAARGAPAIVGLSLAFLGQALPAFALVGLIKRRWPSCRIIVGGSLVTSWISQGSLGSDESFGGLVDALLPGRGEEALAAWLGIAKPGSAGPPDFSDFAELRYFAPTKIIPYNFSSGCPWKRCSFCPEKAEDSPYRGLRRESALHELRSLVAEHRPGLLHLTDNEIAPLYLRALAESPVGVPWYGFARFTPHLGDPGFCAKLAASGCLMLQLGLESGDQAVLDALCKGTDLSMIDRVLANLAEAGIAVYLYVLFGTPAEDRDAALRTRDYIAFRAHRIAFINAAIFNLPVSSPEAGIYASRPFYEGDLALYSDFTHPFGWNRAEVRRFLSRDFGGSPEIGSIMARNPPVFTSNHAPFLLPRSSTEGRESVSIRD